MVPLGAQDKDRHAEEISRLEHELFEASGSLKQSLTANSEYLENLAREVVEREKAQQEMAEAEHRTTKMGAKVAGMATEINRLKKMLGEREGKISTLDVEVTLLEAAKEEAKAEVDRNFDQTLELLKHSFL